MATILCRFQICIQKYQFPNSKKVHFLPYANLCKLGSGAAILTFYYAEPSKDHMCQFRFWAIISTGAVKVRPQRGTILLSFTFEKHPLVAVLKLKTLKIGNSVTFSILALSPEGVFSIYGHLVEKKKELKFF